jgi:hypothetical protein
MPPTDFPAALSSEAASRTLVVFPELIFPVNNIVSHIIKVLYINTGGSTMTRSVKLTNGNKEISLNEFARDTIENIVLGLVKSLKGVDQDKEIVITLGKKE